MIKKYSKLVACPTKAFTLLEALVALLVISGSLLLYQGLTKSIFSQMTYLRENNQDRWLLFSHQLRAELMGSRFQKVEKNKIYVTKDGKDVAYGLSKRDDFRKTSANGHGYHPMLLHLSQATIEEKERPVTIHFVWKDGLERTWLYDFKENR